MVLILSLSKGEIEEVNWARIMNLKLYSRYQNSAGQRVRIALKLKGVDYTYVGVGLNGAISQEDYNRDVNP